MTTRQKISILKKALKQFNAVTTKGDYEYGICDALSDVTMQNDYPPSPEDFGITLPEYKYHTPIRISPLYCWPLDKRGAAIRRRVLMNAIKRLENERANTHDNRK